MQSILITHRNVELHISVIELSRWRGRIPVRSPPLRQKYIRFLFCLHTIFLSTKPRGIVWNRCGQKMINDMKLRRFATEYTGSLCVSCCRLSQVLQTVSGPDWKGEDTGISSAPYGWPKPLLGHLQCRSISAKVFLHATLGIDSMHLGIPPMKTQSKLPEVLSVEEITRLFQCTSNLKHRVMLWPHTRPGYA